MPTATLLTFTIVAGDGSTRGIRGRFGFTGKLLWARRRSGTLSGDQSVWVRAMIAAAWSTSQLVTSSRASLLADSVQVQIAADNPATAIAIAENGVAGREVGLLSTIDAERVNLIAIGSSMHMGPVRPFPVRYRRDRTGSGIFGSS